jgi:hypothetical protein
VEYAVGQPIGYCGNSLLLALGQHGLVRLTAYNLNISYRDHYRFLEDDIIIANDVLSQEYYLLLRKFDIPIS